MVHELTTKAAFDKAMQETDKLCVVDFFADWCGPCRVIAPKIQEMSTEFAGKVTFFKVNVDSNSETAEACGISCMPTFLFYKNGKKVACVQGADEKALRKEIENNM